MNAAQARHVAATLHHVEELLDRAQRPLDGADGALAATAGPGTGVSAEQASTIASAIAGVRSEIRAGVETLELPAASPGPSARWQAATALRLALIALAELDIRHLSHYGDLDPDAAERIRRVRERLEEKLESVGRALEDRAAEGAS